MIIEDTDDEWYCQFILEEHRSMIHVSVEHNVARAQFQTAIKIIASGHFRTDFVFHHYKMYSRFSLIFF